jgi:hypothetical protein
MHNMTRKTKTFFIFLGLVVVGYLGARLGRLSEAVPPDFKEARSQGAVIAQDIVNISNSLNADLDRVNQYEKSRNIAEALNLTTELLGRSEEVKLRAQDLSVQLEKMTGALASIDSPEARALALESITDRLALISRLLSYSDYLSQLLSTLRDRFSGMRGSADVQQVITQINAEVTAINNFNRQASQAMDRFDEATKQK